MSTRLSLLAMVCVVALLCLCAEFLCVQTALAAGATTSVHLVKYGSDGVTVLAERTVDYRWMEENLPVQGDGVTHYYHQGPVFEGDMWDPNETVNLKDKGAVKGTDVKDLCELVGGMSPGDEIVFKAVDGWTLTLPYANVYHPLDRQGPVVLCWYKAGFGYPGNDAYSNAIQIVFMARTENADGKYVFGNTDMRVCLPEEYQHFYNGLPSTDGLSGKWIDEVCICPSGASPPVTAQTTSTPTSHGIPWLSIALGVPGLTLIIIGVYVSTRKRAKKDTN